MENINSCCYVAKINEVKEIVGADNIEQGIIGGWNCIVKKGEYKAGDLVVVATTDAVIPESLSDIMNVTQYLRKGQRVRTVKLRGVYSECLIIPFDYTPRPGKYKEGDDMMKELNVFKYEPPTKTVQLSSGKKIRYSENPNFLIYYKFPNQKNVPGMFSEDDRVQITRKIHGTNARYGIVKKTKLSLLDKIKKFFCLCDRWIEYEFVVGSHNVEKGSDSQGFYDTNVWYEIADAYDIKNKLWDYVKNYSWTGGYGCPGDGVVIYGEIYGKGIQKGYEYGLDHIRFVGFDVMENGKYLDTIGTKLVIRDILKLPHVEELYFGKWSQEIQDKYVFNNFINGTKVPHEGVVVKRTDGERSKISKVINPDYSIFNEKNSFDENISYNH